MKKILLTGASGFIGKKIFEVLNKSTSYDLYVISRKKKFQKRKSYFYSDINSSTDFSKAVFGKEVIIHTAARVHVIQEKSKNPLSEFRKVNVDGTLKLAQQAIKAGVKRFIFISSIKVNGEMTLGSKAFNYMDKPNPKCPYGLSKLEAERGLFKLSKNSSMEVVVIRPPLVYGVGVKGNFLSLIKVILTQLPLPIRTLKNIRSFIALDNLVDLIITCIDHPKASGKVLLVSDGEDTSILKLIQKIARAFNVTPYTFSVPIILIKLFGFLLGKNEAVKSLTYNLKIDSSQTESLLRWKPITTMSQQLKVIAKEYNKKKSNLNTR